MDDSNSSSNYADSSNIIKIMVATDNHLGYEESDPVIGNDSFIAFEEVLKMAVEHKVDMILLGGDLFHHNNPSQQTFNRCMALLRKYTMGDREIFLQLQAYQDIEQSIEGGRPVNYMDENINVSIPVFSIHGNHDDPSGAGLCSSMDTLSSAGLVNYFGKKVDLEHIKISPILFQKGTCRLALYGLSHIKDERLSRLYLHEKVAMLRPKEFTDEWFNIFVLHQNRVDRGLKRYIPESYLPDFLDLVVWGHEHDCDIIQQKNPDRGFYVIQPGSSVPTSLCEGESKPKHVGILEVKEKKKFRWLPLPLKTTRPFVFETVRLADIPVSSVVKQKKSDEIYAFCKKIVSRMINEAKEKVTGHPNQPTLPLIRLRCDYTDETQLFNCVKFGQEFYGSVANADIEIIRFKKLIVARDKSVNKDVRADLAGLNKLQDETPESFSSCVESIVETYFEEFSDKKMLVLSVKGMADAVKRVIEKGDPTAIEAVCLHERQQTIKKLLEMPEADESNIMECLVQIREDRAKNPSEYGDQLDRMFASRASNRSVRSSTGAYTDTIDDFAAASDGFDDDTTDVPARAPSRGRGRKTAAPAADAATASEDDFDSDAAPTGRGRARGRGSRGSRPRGSRARGGRGRAAAAVAPPIANFFTPTPRSTPRSTPTRSAAMSSQASASAAIAYDDYDSDA